MPKVTRDDDKLNLHSFPITIDEVSQAIRHVQAGTLNRDPNDITWNCLMAALQIVESAAIFKQLSDQNVKTLNDWRFGA